VLNIPAVHRKVGNINGESARGVLQLIMKAPYATHPWDDLWRATAVDHQTRDEFWDERNVLPQLDQVDIPVYIGCDWDNVPMHLPSTFTTWKALEHNPKVAWRCAPMAAPAGRHHCPQHHPLHLPATAAGTGTQPLNGVPEMSSAQTLSTAEVTPMCDLDQVIRERRSSRMFLPDKQVRRNVIDEALSLAVCAP
jgi:hypothetical protein